jgi:uncharacterized protein (DUF58 family)
MTHDTKVKQIIAPRTAPKHLLKLLTTLEQTTPGGETSLANIYHELASHHLKRRGLIILISDFFDDLPRLLKALGHLRHRQHEVILFQVLAPEELTFPFKRLTQFRHLETTADKQLVDTRRIRDDYLRNFEEFRQNLKSQAGRQGIDYFQLTTDQPLDRALGLYLTHRQRRG